MTIDFICGVLAELFDSPCNFSPMDEYMFQDEYCEHHCGKVADKDCWKRYFEKRWADRKTEPTISKMEQVDKDINVRSKDELQNDDVFDYCPRCGMRILSKWAKDEPQTERESE